MTSLVDDFKAAFRSHPAGVAVITATVDGEPVGLTASSVTSLSVDPIALSFSVTRDTGSAGALLRADSFVVHLLGEDHADIAAAFALSGAPRFTAEQGWARLPTGEPHLPAAPVALHARASTVIEVGSSRLIVAEVFAVHRGPDSGPLLYQDRRFLRLASTQSA